MEVTRQTGRYWPIAVTISLVLHGATVLGLALLPGRCMVHGGGGSGTEFSTGFLEVDPGGEVQFIGERDPPPATNHSQTKVEPLDPAGVTLVSNLGPSSGDPSLGSQLVQAGGNTGSSGNSGTGGVGIGPKGSASFFQVE